jgi:hypothetical protein
MMIWTIWVITLLLFLLPVIWGYRRWGAPRPYYIRRRGIHSETRVRTEPGWGAWADLLWVFTLVLIAWFLFALLR